MSAIRLLITGANGFVGRHVIEAARRHARIEVSATAREATTDADGTHFAALDIEDREALHRTLRDARPTHVLHLAGISTAAPGTQGAHGAIWRTNTMATIDLAAAILAEAPRCWLMFAGSGLVYGATARDRPTLDESAPLAPANAYAATKAAADLGLGAMAAADGLETIRFRPFNHTGAGQSEAFAIPAFAAQIARIEAGAAEPVIKVGDLSAERDFLDVGDVVDAYLAAILHSDRLRTGTILNLASGVARRMEAVLASLLAMSRTPIHVVTDTARLRPGDIPRYVGDAAAAVRLLDWSPSRPFEATLRAVLDDQRRKVAKPV